MTYLKDKTSDYIGKTIKVVIDRPIGSRHHKYEWRYGLNYGYVPGTLSGDGEEIDAYVMGVSEPVKEFKGECIAVIHRTDDDDDKLIIAAPGMSFDDEEIRSATDFQERFFESVIVRGTTRSK